MKRIIYKKDKHGKKKYIEKGILQEPVVEKSQVLYYKDFLYNCYAKTAGSGYNKMEKDPFLKALKNDCLDSLFKEVRPKPQADGKRPTFQELPALEEAQEMFNKLQGFEYSYTDAEEDEWEYDSDSDSDSD